MSVFERVIYRCSVGNYEFVKELQFKWFKPDFGKSLTWLNLSFLTVRRLSQPPLQATPGLLLSITKLIKNLNYRSAKAEDTNPGSLLAITPAVTPWTNPNIACSPLLIIDFFGDDCDISDSISNTISFNSELSDGSISFIWDIMLSNSSLEWGLIVFSLPTILVVLVAVILPFPVFTCSIIHYYLVLF